VPVTPADYPIVLSLEGRSCLVVGGGPVALRKVVGLVAAGAAVTVVAPQVIDDIAALGVAVERRRYRRGDLAGRFVAIAATGDPEVDGAVSADGAAAGVLINVADDPARCVFTLPALARRGPVVVAVSTGGVSPALATWLRNRIADALPDGLDELVALIGNARSRVRGAGTGTEGLKWHELIDTVAGALERRDGTAEAAVDAFVAAASGRRGIDPPDRGGTVS
jgi:siroheme synthase-like protein